MHRALIIDNDTDHADGLRELLRRHSCEADRAADSEQAVMRLRCYAERYELVILTIADNRSPWWRILEKLRDVCQCSERWSAPLFLCIGRIELRPEFILRLERLGARYVRER